MAAKGEVSDAPGLFKPSIAAANAFRKALPPAFEGASQAVPKPLGLRNEKDRPLEDGPFDFARFALGRFGETAKSPVASGRSPVAGTSPYSRIFDTTPEPTVRPPSRMAKRRPSSIAIGAISSASNFRLSPGITISVPEGSCTVPVTSVVRK